MSSIFLRSLVFGISCLLGVVCPAAMAQETPGTLQPGETVRATVYNISSESTGAQVIKGKLLELDDKLLILETSPDDPPLSIARADILDLELRVKKSRHGRGALIGLGVAASLGALVGYADGDDPAGFVSFSAGAKAGMLAIVFAPVGALVGALASPGEEWESLSSGQVHMWLSRSPQGEPGIFLSARF